MMSASMALRKKLVVVGDGMCGKTCLLLTFVQDEFPVVYIPTVFETFVADMHLDGKDMELALWDTAGQEDFGRLRQFSYPNASVFLIVFSIDSLDSFENVADKWCPEINHFCGKNVPKILVGTKKDLRGKGKSTVSFEQGRQLAERIKAVQYVECSSMQKSGVVEVFEASARATLRQKKVKKYKKLIQCIKSS